MRARHNFRRDIIAAIIYLFGAIGGTSYAIQMNQRPNGIVWFPWIVGGWFLIGGAATWFGVVLTTHAMVWTRYQTAMPRRMPSRAEVGRPPVRPFTPAQNAAITARMQEDYEAGVRAATERAQDLDPAPNLEATADRVHEGFAARTGGATAAMEAFDTAREDKPEGYIPSHGIDPVTGRLYVDGKHVMPAAVQRVLIPQNPSPGLADAIARAHGAVNPAVTITEADV